MIASEILTKMDIGRDTLRRVLNEGEFNGDLKVETVITPKGGNAKGYYL